MFQPFRGTILDASTAAFPTITATTETVLVPTIFTPIPAMAPRAGQILKLTVMGTVTTGASGTLGIQPRYGLVIGGTGLTASALQTVVPSITLAPFTYECWLVFRSIGVAAGANSNVVCYGRWSSAGATATASSETVVLHGTTGSVAVDTTVASGLWIGVTFSVAPSVIPHVSIWESLN